MSSISISRKSDQLAAFGDFTTPSDVIEAIDSLQAKYGIDVNGTIATLSVQDDGDQWCFQIGGPASDLFIYVGAGVTEDMPTTIVVDGDKPATLSATNVSAKFQIEDKVTDHG